MILQDRIQERLDDLGLNPLRAAKKSKLGDDFVRDILRGKTKAPSAENLAKLANTLECSVSFLLGATDLLEGATKVDIPIGTETLSLARGPDGTALLELRAKLPMGVALEIIAMIEGVAK